MSKKLRHEMRYDGATPEQVYAMLATPDFREQVCEYQRFPKRSVTITPVGDGMRVKVDQHRPADEVPSFARKLVGDEINIVQEEQWSSPTSAKLQVSIPGKPGEMNGSVSITGDAGGTTELVEVEIKVNIPLIGGKIEGFIADMLLRALKAENKVGRRWLAGEA
ncbi:MAG TPA: DUF2505 domain-containing protein [Marmoricola sp.]|nr:DUF2505 domain-containing protein [Marmoricola sp.]